LNKKRPIRDVFLKNEGGKMKIVEVISEEELRELFKKDKVFVLEGFEIEKDESEYTFYSYTFNFQHDIRIYRYRLAFREYKNKTKIDVVWKNFASVKNEQFDKNRVDVKNENTTIRKEEERGGNLIRKMIRKELKNHPYYKIRLLLGHTKVTFNRQPL